jgi:hypothetical protein
MSKLNTPPAKYAPDWLQQLDQRTGVAQVMRQRYQAFTSDLGGEDNLSYAKQCLVNRALWLEYWIAQQELGMATGQDVDMGRYTQAVNSLQGLLVKIGLDRVAKDAGTLAEYLSKRPLPKELQC